MKCARSCFLLFTVLSFAQSLYLSFILSSFLSLSLIDSHPSLRPLVGLTVLMVLLVIVLRRCQWWWRCWWSWNCSCSNLTQHCASPPRKGAVPGNEVEVLWTVLVCKVSLDNTGHILAAHDVSVVIYVAVWAVKASDIGPGPTNSPHAGHFLLV